MPRWLIAIGLASLALVAFNNYSFAQDSLESYEQAQAALAVENAGGTLTEEQTAAISAWRAAEAEHTLSAEAVAADGREIHGMGTPALGTVDVEVDAPCPAEGAEFGDGQTDAADVGHHPSLLCLWRRLRNDADRHGAVQTGSLDARAASRTLRRNGSSRIWHRSAGQRNGSPVDRGQ